MGVPGFFKKQLEENKRSDKKFLLKKEDNQLEESIREEINNIDYLLIDANCLIHPQCAKILSENENYSNLDSLENSMMNQSLAYIQSLYEYIRPNIGIYIAIDGPAPYAKMKQQRYRRFKSYHDKIMYNNIKKKHNRPVTKDWNSSAITPGTLFMEKLHNKIIEWSQQRDYQVMYSSCKTPGEGEHKLLQFIRDNQSNNINYRYMMYGLDADLIFLCLSTNIDDMYLLRESNQINKRDTGYSIVSIDRLRTSIYDTINNKLLEKEQSCMVQIDDKHKVINDYIFICYFLGNDFLPHNPAIDIYDGGYDLLLDTYIELLGLNECSEFMINRDNRNIINNVMFKHYMEMLANKEEDLLKEQHTRIIRKHRCQSTDPYDIELHRINNLMFRVNDPIELGKGEKDEWKQRYYEYYFHIEETEEETKEETKEGDLIESMVDEYLKGLKWVTEYYFKDCMSWEWYYPFSHPPFLEDIFNVINRKNIDINSYKIKKGKPLEPLNQLLQVLPPQSMGLVPRALRKIALHPDSPASYLYPIRFEQDFIGKRMYWMGEPKLPPMNFELVNELYKRYKKKLNREEKLSNRTENLFIFN